MKPEHSYRVTQIVKSAKQTRNIDTSILSPERKRILWAGIKQLDPLLADVLAVDEALKTLKDNFNTTVLFSQADFDRFTKAGRLVIGEKQ